MVSWKPIKGPVIFFPMIEGDRRSDLNILTVSIVCTVWFLLPEPFLRHGRFKMDASPKLDSLGLSSAQANSKCLDYDLSYASSSQNNIWTRSHALKMAQKLAPKSICLLVPLFVVLCSSLPLVSSSRIGNCSSMPTEVMERPGVRYEISGPSVLLYPTNAAGERLPNISCEWTFALIVERAKSLDENGTGHLVPMPVSPTPEFDLSSLLGSEEESGRMESGSFDSRGSKQFEIRAKGGLKTSETIKLQSAQKRHVKDDDQEFNSLGDSWSERVDPLEPRNESRRCTTHGTHSCGEILNYMRMSEMDCYGVHETKPFKGFERETFWLFLSHPSYPSFQLIIEHHLLDAHLEYWGNTSGVQEHYQYKYDFPTPFAFSKCIGLPHYSSSDHTRY